MKISLHTLYNLCKQKYESRDPSSEWFVNLVSMVNTYGDNFIPNQEAIVKTVVKQMHTNLKN